MILITCPRVEEEKLKEFIRREDSIVFVFEDESSMDHIRRLFLGSQRYLDSGFYLTDIEYIGKSTSDKIKYLKYISGVESFMGREYSFSFLNESSHIDILKKLKDIEGDHIWILKDEEGKLEIEGFYVT